MKNTLSTLSLLALLAGTSHAVVIADLGGDWIDSSTLPTGWGYFDSTGLPSASPTLTALAPNLLVGNGGNTGFGGGTNTFNLGAVLGSINGGAEFEIFGDGQANHGGVEGTDLLVHAGDDANLGSDGVDFLIVRYTISAADVTNGTTATIAGGFQGSLGSRIGSVYHNTTQLYASTDGTPDRLTTGAFNVSTTVAAGDTIDFVVDNGVNLFGDETSIRGTIDLVPEPGSMMLLGLGSLLALRRRRC